MIEAMENCEEGIVVGGQVVGDIRFADDRDMVSSSEDGLQRLMDRLNETASRFNMKINVQKTKTMVVNRDVGEVVNITIDGQKWSRLRTSNTLASNENLLVGIFSGPP